MSLKGNNSGSRSLDYDLEQTRPASNSTLTITNGDDGGSLPPNSTVIKYEKSSCLFCNEWFDSQTFTEHLIHCGQVLEQCPNSCNVFVPRIRMRSHLKECPRTKQQRLSATSLERLERLDQQVEHRVQVLEQDTGTLRSVLNEEIRQRLHLITDVGNLRKLNQVQDDRTQRTEEMISTLRKCIEEESGQRCYEIEQCQKDFRYCYDLTQSMKAELQHDVEEMREHVNKVSLQVTEHQNHLNDNIIKLEELMLEQEKINRDKFVECEDYLSTISGDLKTKFVTNADLSSKIANLDLEVKSMKNIVCDTEERCEKLEAIVEQMDRSLHHTMQSLADLEHHMATHQRLASVQNTRGHLIWRIKDYSKKLEEAKQYDTILHSAMFSNKPFGYNLRLDIYLNGKGTWRGRNIIACLNVLAGEYDPLLAWPCRCQAEISIREQGVNPDNAQDYVKVVPVRKKSDEQLQANSFFYIPHKVIASNNYLKNDSFFIEVRMLK